MAPMAHTIQHSLSGPRGGTALAFAGLLAAFMMSSCTDELPERTETTSSNSPQVQTETQPNQMPLPDMMQALERDLAAVGAGLWREDLQAVIVAARRVADHPSTTLEYRQAIQEELGDHFPRFVEYDQEVHYAARRLAERAEGGAPIVELLELQHEVARGCVGCHTGFRSRLQPAMDRLRSDDP